MVTIEPTPDFNSQVIEIGSVQTLPAGSDATATLQMDENKLVLNLGIPRGANGSPGPQGLHGQAAAPIDVEALAEAIRESLPPFTVRSKGEHGIVFQAVVPLGGVLDLPGLTVNSLTKSKKILDTVKVAQGGVLNIELPDLPKPE